MPGRDGKHPQPQHRHPGAEHPPQQQIEHRQGHTGAQELGQAQRRYGTAQHHHGGDGKVALQHIHPAAPGDKVTGVAVSHGIHPIVEQGIGLVPGKGLILVESSGDTPPLGHTHRHSQEHQEQNIPLHTPPGAARQMHIPIHGHASSPYRLWGQGQAPPWALPLSASVSCSLCPGDSRRSCRSRRSSRNCTPPAPGGGWPWPDTTRTTLPGQPGADKSHTSSLSPLKTAGSPPGTPGRTPARPPPFARRWR